MPKAVLVLDEMPNNCSECPCRNEEDFECNNQYKGYISDYLEWNSGRPSWCPLKPLQKGHGKLIDAEEYRKEMLEKGGFDFFATLDMQPIIIEADKGDERMKITLEIPKEFEEHFKNDRFEDSLHRLSADIHSLAGNYERETIDMLIEAFRNAKILEEKDEEYIEQLIRKDKSLPVYLEGDGYADGELVYDTAICENCNTPYEVDYEHYKYCPNCGQKLDWSEVEK